MKLYTALLKKQIASLSIVSISHLIILITDDHVSCSVDHFSLLQILQIIGFSVLNWFQGYQQAVLVSHNNQGCTTRVYVRSSTF